MNASHIRSFTEQTKKYINLQSNISKVRKIFIYWKTVEKRAIFVTLSWALLSMQSYDPPVLPSRADFTEDAKYNIWVGMDSTILQLRVVPANILP